MALYEELDNYCSVCKYVYDDEIEKSVCPICCQITIYNTNDNILVPLNHEPPLCDKIDVDLKPTRYHEQKKTIRSKGSDCIEPDIWINKHDTKYKETYIKVSEPNDR